MVFDHTSLNMTFPILTLVFFDPLSYFFSESNSFAERSMWYGLCVSTPHIINIFSAPLLSVLSDEFGRRKILLLGIFGAVIFALTAALGVLYGSLSLLFLGFVIRGAFSRTNPIAQAIIGDISNKEMKVLHMGYLQGAISIGAFLGPIIGGYFANRYFFSTFNFSLPFFIAAIVACLSLLMAWVFFKETLIEKRNLGILQHFHYQNILPIINYPGTKRILIVLLLSQISWALYYQYIPPILKTSFQFTAEQLGLFVGLIAVWLTLATVVGIKLLQRYFSVEQMLAQSINTILIGLILSIIAIFIHNPYLIWLAAIPTAIGDVIAYSCIIAFFSNAVQRSEQGKAMGLCFIIVATIWALTGIAGGFMMSITPSLPLLITPFTLLIVIVLLRLTHFKICRFTKS